MTTLKGRCLCGKVTWTATGRMRWAAYCHCESCRRAVSAPFVALFGVADEGLTWSGPVGRYHSSSDVERGFCTCCGSPLFYRNPVRWPAETHIPAATLEDPSVYAPKAHVYYSERLPWIEMRDGLPKYDSTGDDGTRPLTDDEAHG